MSLLVWIPMVHGDCKDQGLLGVETSVVNTVTYVDGKLGKAAQIGNGNQVTNGISINTNLVEELGTQYSCSVWVKPLGNHVHYEGAIISSGDWNKKCWAFGVNQDNSKVDIFCGGYNRNVTCSVPVNEWTHLVSVNDGTHTHLYKNGELISTATTSSWPLSSDATITTVGRESYAGGYFSFNGCVQDLRIYDHALSPLEVKHLAQGLVLHYPLNRGGLGQDNLVNGLYAGGRTMVNNGIVTALLSQNSDCYFHFTCSEDLLTENDYTISMDVSGFSGSDKYLVWGIISQNSGQNITMRNGKCFAIFSPSSNITAGTKIIIDDINRATSGLTDLTIRNIKVEHGSIPTPWTPAPSDDLYSQMGLDNNIEYDVSGYGNNGTKNGTFSVTSNTSRYSTSTVFNGNNNAIKIPFNSMLGESTDYTVSVWIYKTSIGTKNYQTILGGPSGFELEARSSTNTSPLFRLHNWGGGTTPYNFNEWTLFTFVRTASDSKLYVNGELRITGTAGSIPSGNYWIGSWSTATSQNYEGLMSDFRVYATALSADDVMALYKNAGYVDSDGNVYAYEMTE